MKQKRGVGSSFGILILIIVIAALLFSESIPHKLTHTAFRFMVIMWTCLILLNIYCFTKILQKK